MFWGLLLVVSYLLGVKALIDDLKLFGKEKDTPYMQSYRVSLDPGETCLTFYVWLLSHQMLHCLAGSLPYQFLRQNTLVFLSCNE